MFHRYRCLCLHFFCWTTAVPGGLFSGGQLTWGAQAVRESAGPARSSLPAELSLVRDMDLLRGQSPVSQLSANLFHSVAPASLRAAVSEGLNPVNRQEPQVEPDVQQLKMAAHAELSRLRRRAGNLGPEDTAPLWEAIRRLYETGYKARVEVVFLYSLMSDLPLGLRDRLEVSRFLGQDCLFSSDYEGADRIFEQGIAAFNAADQEQQQQVAGKMANIFYLRGILRDWQQAPELGLENDRALRENRILWDATPVATKASLLDRLGDALASRQEFDGALEAWREALEVVRGGGEPRVEKRTTVTLLIKILKVEVAAGKTVLPEALTRLEQMRTRYAEGNWVGMQEVLRQLALYYRQNRETENYQKTLRSLCDWYREQVPDPFRVFLTAPEVQQGILDSSKLLVLSHLESGDRKAAVELIRETIRRDKPPEWWWNHFPPDVATEAGEQSVVGESTGAGRDRVDRPSRPDGGER